MRRAWFCFSGMLMAMGCTEFDPNDRRAAVQSEYAINELQCEQRDGRLVATGDLVNYSGRTTGFFVIVRFLDGDVDLGRPQEVAHPDPLADGETWQWEVGLAIDGTPAVPRCNVIQVGLGDNVTRKGK